MRLTVEQARGLVDRVMCAVGYDADDARLIADHLIDCELRGVAYGGLARALSVVERVGRTGVSRAPIRVTKESPVSASLDGGDRIGYVVAYRAMQLAIEKASAAGIAIVGAHNTWYTGMLSYYAEKAAARGLVSIIASNASPWVAPHGSSEGRFGTNPICVGFPCRGVRLLDHRSFSGDGQTDENVDGPVIWDIGTSAIMHAEVALAQRLGEQLPEGVAFDAAGRPTRDPAAALDGAFAAWGGHKGSGLGIVVQLFGALAGSPAIPPEMAGFGMIVIAIRPDVLTDTENFQSEVARYAESVREARPVEGGPAVRMPFDRSRAERRRRLEENAIDVADAVHATLVEIARVPRP
jgi:LDH2 family malate/lactate/ureidoglycolate dehydrogenase